MRRTAVLWTALVAVPVVVVGLMAGYLQLRDDGAVAVPTDGGRATSRDGAVSVVFGPDQVSTGTRVRVRTEVAARPLPDLVAPMTEAFDITATTGRAVAGAVTVELGPLAADTDVDRIVMMIDDGPTGWQMLSTEVNVSTGAVTAQWPHFSKGRVGCLSSLGWRRIPVKECVKAATTAATDTARAAADAATSATHAMADKVTELVLPLAGGTNDTAKCEPAGTDWTFADARGSADQTLQPLLTGCAGPLDQTGARWPARIGNQYPYPFLVRLPRGVVGPGALDLASDADPAELLYAMGASLLDLAVIPGGGQTPVTIHANARDRLMLTGYMDPVTLAVKAIIVAAMIFSRGKSAELRAAARAETKVFMEQLRAGSANGKAYTNAEFAADTGWNSPTARKERQAALGDAAPTLFAAIDLTQCLFTAGKSLIKTGFEEAMKGLLGQCWPAFAGKLAEAGVKEFGERFDPKVQQEKTKALVGEVLNSVRDLPRLVNASLAPQMFAATGGKVDLLRATLVATRAGTTSQNAPVTGLGSFDWPIHARQDLTDCGDTTKVSLSRPDPVNHDVTGDGIPDTFVVLRCSPEFRAGQLQVYDGASDPSNPSNIGILTYAAKPGSPRFDFQYAPALQFTDNSVTFSGVIALDSNEAQFARQTFTWDGAGFVPGPLRLDYPD